MKIVRSLIVALAVIASAAVANAATNVWYGTANTGGNSAGVAGGAVSTPLNLTCDTSLAGNTCSWVISMNITSTPGLIGWTASLNGAVGSGLAVAGPAIPGTSPWQGLGNAGNFAGPLPSLLAGSQAQAGAIPGAQAGTSALTFTLTRSYVAGNLSATDVLATIPVSPTGVGFYSNALDDWDQVSFAANAPVYADDSGPHAFQLPVIHVQNVPEPTTLALLAIGGLAALRRRAR